MDRSTFNWAIDQVACSADEEVRMLRAGIGREFCDPEWFANGTWVGDIFDRVGVHSDQFRTPLIDSDGEFRLPPAQDLKDFLEEIFQFFMYEPVEYLESGLYRRFNRYLQEWEFTADGVAWEVAIEIGQEVAIDIGQDVWDAQSHVPQFVLEDPVSPTGVDPDIFLVVDSSSEDDTSCSEDERPAGHGRPRRRDPAAGSAKNTGGRAGFTLNLAGLPPATGAPTPGKAGARSARTPGSRPRLEERPPLPSFRRVEPDDPGSQQRHVATGREWDDRLKAYFEADQAGARTYFLSESDQSPMTGEQLDEHRNEIARKHREVGARISRRTVRASKEELAVWYGDKREMDEELRDADRGGVNAPPVIYFNLDSVAQREVMRIPASEGSGERFKAFGHLVEDDYDYGWVMDPEQKLYIFEPGLEVLTIERNVTDDPQLAHLVEKNVSWSDQTTMQLAREGLYRFRYRHSSHPAGGEVLCAGILAFGTDKRGVQKISRINNDSGHYKPFAENLASVIHILHEKQWIASDAKARIIGKTRGGGVSGAKSGTLSPLEFAEAAALGKRYDIPLPNADLMVTHKDVAREAARKAFRHPVTSQTANEALLESRDQLVQATYERYRGVVDSVRRKEVLVPAEDWDRFASYLDRQDAFRNIRFMINSDPEPAWEPEEAKSFYERYTQQPTLASTGYDGHEADESFQVAEKVVLSALRDTELTMIGESLEDHQLGTVPPNINAADLSLDPSDLGITFADGQGETRTLRGTYSSEDD